MTPRQTWTVVQHSATAQGHAEFEAGLETALVVTKAARRAVLDSGGLLFEDWGDAEEFLHREQYPPGTTGLVPAAPGTFAEATVGGLRVYRPVASCPQS